MQNTHRLYYIRRGNVTVMPNGDHTAHVPSPNCSHPFHWHQPMPSAFDDPVAHLLRVLSIMERVTECSSPSDIATISTRSRNSCAKYSGGWIKHTASQTVKIVSPALWFNADGCGCRSFPCPLSGRRSPHRYCPLHPGAPGGRERAVECGAGGARKNLTHELEGRGQKGGHRSQVPRRQDNDRRGKHEEIYLQGQW